MKEYIISVIPPEHDDSAVVNILQEHAEALGEAMSCFYNKQVMDVVREQLVYHSYKRDTRWTLKNTIDLKILNIRLAIAGWVVKALKVESFFSNDDDF